MVEVNHIIPKKDGGSSKMKNLRLTHGRYHD